MRRWSSLLIAGLLALLLVVFLRSESYQKLPQVVGFGEYGPTEEEKANALPDLRTKRPPHLDVGLLSVGKDEAYGHTVKSDSPYPVGKTKPVGSNYTRCLVVPKLKMEDTRWIDDALGDMLDSGLLRKAVYVVDDRRAPLHPPNNKGHEVMVYLSYIIDSYDDLADVNIFMHAHQKAWHNNELLNGSSAEIVRHLSPERVTREGYLNLRCSWEPGCPSWMHPGATERNIEKPEEWLVAEAWAELFPRDPIPIVLSQPCCAQFAVSRERVQEIPKQRYVQMRDWILRTDLSDYYSGRVFEYVWQYIFTASPLYCPSMAACYCDGYGLCFGSPESLEHWFELRLERNEYEEELRVWKHQAEMIEYVKEQSSDGKLDEEAVIEVPRVGRDEWLVAKMEEMQSEMDDLRARAFERGRDPKQRALESGREWTDGDGF